MAKLQPVRGTHDIFPEEARKRRLIEDTARNLAERYGYGEVRTPIFEFSDVFHRTLGDTSDIVSKETYTFTDRGGESITLRPEFTASIARAFISEGLQNELPLKYFYRGPAFRYERPQKGRLRQFHQLGVELLGIAEPEADAEVIALATQLLSALGFNLNNHIRLELNSLGDAESRTAYRTALIAYFNDHRSHLSDESKERLERNPLRILDSKQEQDQKLVVNAPNAKDYFTPQATDFFARVVQGLDNLNIAYHLNPRLVRGLDYYNHTVFEFTTELLGAQGTVLAGGRYDGLIKLMGGTDTPGIGFAAGIERLLALSEVANTLHIPASPTPIAIIPIGDAAETESWKLAHSLRAQGFYVDVAFKGNPGKRMKRADKIGASIAIMLGEDELKNSTVTLKTMTTGKQKTIPRAELMSTLSKL